MSKEMWRSLTALIVAQFTALSAHASEYRGPYVGAKFGINNSSASGAINAPNQSAVAYGVQGRYFEGGYSWDINSAALGIGTYTVGLGGYADYNPYLLYANGVGYGSRAYGLNVKIGVPFDDWLIYGKVGDGYSTGTSGLNDVTVKSRNGAIGFEYKFLFRLGAVVEYKVDGFGSNGTLIKNKTLSFGLNYYFDRPAEAPKVVATAEPEVTDLETEPENPTEVAEQPPPDIAASATALAVQVTPAVMPDPESWKDLSNNKSVRVDGFNFVDGAVLVGEEIITGAVNFRPGQEIKILDEVAKFAAKYPKAKLEVTGYSDNVGTEEFNQKQSLGRALTAKAYLVNKGVAPSRISAVGLGIANPIGDNATYEGRITNHRVEIRAVGLEKVKAAPAAETPEQKSIPAAAIPSVPPAAAPAAEVLAAPAVAAAAPAPGAESVPESWGILLKDQPVLVTMESASSLPGSEGPNKGIAKQLDEVVEFANKYPEKKLELAGYADNYGPEAVSRQLSLARAETIKKYLVQKGIDPGRIEIRGEGSANPVGDNKTRAGRIKNRRVEIRAVTKASSADGSSGGRPQNSSTPSIRGIGIGDLRVFSSLGEPLRAQIELVGVRRKGKERLFARLANKEDYDKKGLVYPAYNAFYFEIRRTTNGIPFIDITSDKPVNELYLTLLVELDFQRGKLLKEYILLLNPAGYAPGQSARPTSEGFAPTLQGPGGMAK